MIQTSKARYLRAKLDVPLAVCNQRSWTWQMTGISCHFDTNAWWHLKCTYIAIRVHQLSSFSRAQNCLQLTTRAHLVWCFTRVFLTWLCATIHVFQHILPLLYFTSIYLSVLSQFHWVQIWALVCDGLEKQTAIFYFPPPNKVTAKPHNHHST